MYLDFNAFTRMFFYLFVCYHYSKYKYPEKTEQFLICMGYNTLYLFSKLQILFYKTSRVIHDFLIKYEEYQKTILLIEKTLNDFNSSTALIDSQTNVITLDFILNNEIQFTFEKQELINDYLSDFFPDDDELAQPKESILSVGRKAVESILLPGDDIREEEIENEHFDDKKESKDDSIIDYDFIIINGEDSLKKIIKHIDLIKNDFISEYSSIFKLESFLYKPLLCEFLNGDDEKPTKIDFCDNNKFYDFFVVGNCFDKTFLTYFMKKYYEIDVKDNYILKILDNNVNTILFDESDIFKLDENCISKVDK
jgi:hypothetical protein